MRYGWFLLLIPMLTGCDVVAPSLLTGAALEGVSPEVFVNASVSVLHDQGYTVVVADRAGGIVTTDWRDESSFAGQVFLELSHRTRISVVVDFATLELKVQMTKQKKEGDLPWRNDGLSDNDRERMRAVLELIQSRARAIHGQNTPPVT